jgi:hypothetical protein
MLACDLGKSFERSFREQVFVVQRCLHSALGPGLGGSQHFGREARYARIRTGWPGLFLRSFIVTDHQFPVAKVLTQHAVVSPANRVQAAEGWNGYRNERALPPNMAGMGLAGWRKAPFLAPSRLCS